MTEYQLKDKIIHMTDYPPRPENPSQIKAKDVAPGQRVRRTSFTDEALVLSETQSENSPTISFDLMGLNPKGEPIILKKVKVARETFLEML